MLKRGNGHDDACVCPLCVEYESDPKMYEAHRIRDRLIDLMASTTREDLWDEIMRPFCRSCGSTHLPCYCERDE